MINSQTRVPRCSHDRLIDTIKSSFPFAGQPLWARLAFGVATNRRSKISVVRNHAKVEPNGAECSESHVIQLLPSKDNFRIRARHI